MFQSLFFLGVIALFFGKAGLFTAAVLAVLGVLVLIFQQQKQESVSLAQGEEQAAILMRLIERHKAELLGRQKLLTTWLPYGRRDDKAWKKEKATFVREVLLPALGGQELILTYDSVSASIDKALAELQAQPSQLGVSDAIEPPRNAQFPFKTFDENPLNTAGYESPVHFEVRCAEILTRAGWVTSLTKASGDQGADIVVEKPGLRGVVQCKLYSSPIGNTAVQEVYAAKGIYNATFAAVVSNHDYTVSARQAAAALDVILLNDFDLKHLYARLQGVIPPQDL